MCWTLKLVLSSYDDYINLVGYWGDIGFFPQLIFQPQHDWVVNAKNNLVMPLVPGAPVSAELLYEPQMDTNYGQTQ